MRKICLVGQFPPPIHGLSKALEALYNSKLANEYVLEKINITNNRIFIRNMLFLLHSKADIFYLTISQSKYGNIRDLIILKLMQFKKKKIVIHLHGGYFRHLLECDLPKWQRRWNIRVLQKIDRCIVLGPSLTKCFEGIVDSNRIAIVPNFVDDDIVLSQSDFEHKMKTWGEGETRRVLFLSNLLEAKGYKDVLELALLEKTRQKKCNDKKLLFDFAGAFLHEEDCKYFWDYVRQHDIGDIVRYHGVVVGAEKYELLRDCSYFVLLSRNEGQPISIIEAMGAGLHIITTNVGGIPDLIDVDDGFVVDITNENYIDRVLHYCLELHGTDSLERNRRRVMNEFRQHTYYSNMKKVFDEI